MQKGRGPHQKADWNRDQHRQRKTHQHATNRKGKLDSDSFVIGTAVTKGTLEVEPPGSRQLRRSRKPRLLRSDHRLILSTHRRGTSGRGGGELPNSEDQGESQERSENGASAFHGAH